MSNLIVARRSLLLGGAAVAADARPSPSPPAPMSASPRRCSPPSTATARPGRWPTSRARSWCSRRRITTAPMCASTTRSTNMQTQQREAAAKGVVWLTSASSATGEQGYVTAAAGQRADQEPRRRARRRAARSAKQDRARLRRHRDAAHVHHRCQRHPGLQGRHRFDPVGRHRRHSQGQAVCARRRSTKCWPASR